MRLFLALLLLGLAAPTWADCPPKVVVPFNFEKITVSSTALGFTTATAFPDSGPADLVVCRVETDSIRYRVDGVSPVAATGMLKASGEEFTVCGVTTAKRFRMIRVTTDATVSCTYYRSGDN